MLSTQHTPAFCFLLYLASPGTVPAQSPQWTTPGGPIELPRLVINKLTLPQWHYGKTVQVDFDTGTVYIREGTNTKTMRPLLPGGRQQITKAGAISPDGAIVVLASGTAEDGRTSSFLMFHDSSGQLLRTVPTRPYAPFHVRYAPDGTLWAVGRVYDERFEAVPGHEMVRQYSGEGKLLRTALSASLFPPSRQHPGRTSALAVAGDRIAVLLETAGEGVRVGSNGRILGR